MKRFLLPRLVLLSFLLSILPKMMVTGQVHGRITESGSGKPVENVNVFIPFTSTGTTSNIDGDYRLDSLPPGEIRLVFRHITYEPREFSLIIPSEGSVQQDVSLTEATIGIGEVIRQAGEVEWVYGMILFKELLLGDPYESSCILKNPRDLYFYFDGDVIYGQARQPLRISNNYLGYDLTYYMDYFKYDNNRISTGNLPSDQYFAYGGLALYRDKNALLRIKKTKWKKNREAEFQGSLRHFLRELYQDSLAVRKYQLRQVIPDGQDSLFCWDTGEQKGRFIHFSGNAAYPFPDSVLTTGPGTDHKTFVPSGPVLVFYNYRNTPELSDDRASLLELDQGTLIFNGKGEYRVPAGNLNWIYLDSQKRVRTMLPMDYQMN